MGLFLWSSSHDLFNALHQSGKFQVEKNEGGSSVGENDILVIDGNFIDFTEISLEYMKQVLTNKIFYIMPQHMMQVDVELLKKDMPNITFLPPRLTVNQVVEQIILSSHEGMEEQDRNIHLFYGADSKVGTTMIAQVNAELIAEYTDQKVCLLLMGNNPVHYFDSKSDVGGIDTIKIKLFTDILTKEDLIKSSIKTKHENLIIIPGPANIQDRRYYQPEHAEKLIDLASKHFDMVIVDAGCDVERGLSVGAVRMAKSKFLVTTQQQNARDEFLRVADQVFKPLQIEKKHFFCILNKNIAGGLQSKQITAAYGMPVVGTVPYLDVKGWQAEIEHKSLLHYNDVSYYESIAETARFICELQSVKFTLEKKKGFLTGWLK